MKPILILLILLLAVAICNAQQPTKADTIALVKQFQAEHDTKEYPLWLLCGSTKNRSTVVVKGYSIGLKFYDSKKMLLPDYIIVFGSLPRTADKK